MASNGSKPYQASLIQEFGFAVPATLLTTDPAAVLEFWEQHGTVVYKSISGVRSIVAQLSSSRLTDLEKVRWCPTQFQQHIRGRDYRVHVVGDDVFPCEVLSAADDYRYDPDTVGRRACVLPADIAERCRTMAAALGLVVAGIDLRRAPEDEWYCFEVNPSPAFTYSEEATGQPMAVAIAALLMKGHSASHAFVPV